MPRTKIRGRNTTTVVRVLATIAEATSSVPSTAPLTASPWRLPSRSRWMFSSTTIELSTSMPTPRARPPSDTRFSVKPPKYTSMKVATMEIGMAAAMTTVLRMLRRNTSSTRTA
jgi:hypothetical protein